MVFMQNQSIWKSYVFLVPLGWFVWCEFCPTNEEAKVDVKFDDVPDILSGKENVLLREVKSMLPKLESCSLDIRHLNRPDRMQNNSTHDKVNSVKVGNVSVPYLMTMLMI